MTPSILSISGQAKSYVGYTLGGKREREGRERGEEGGKAKRREIDTCVCKCTLAHVFKK